MLSLGLWLECKRDQDGTGGLGENRSPSGLRIGVVGPVEEEVWGFFLMVLQVVSKFRC